MVRLVVRLRAYGPGTPNGIELVSVYSLLNPKPYTALANPRSETRKKDPRDQQPRNAKNSEVVPQKGANPTPQKQNLTSRLQALLSWTKSQGVGAQG